MGLGGISVWQLLIILAIVVLLFGTKRLSSLGSDIGSAIRGFRKAMQDDTKPEDKRLSEGKTHQSDVIEGEAQHKDAHKEEKH